MVVAQLVERSLPIPEVRGSNPVSDKKYIEHFTVNCIEKTKIKKKRPGRAHFFKKVIWQAKHSFAHLFVLKLYRCWNGPKRIKKRPGMGSQCPI